MRFHPPSFLPDAVFCFLSGQGAGRDEKSKVAFARYKGMAENGLLAVGFPRIHIFRPGYIYPVTPREEPNLVYKLFRPVYPILKFLYPNLGISSENIAQAMVAVGLDGRLAGNKTVLENRDIREVVTKC